MKKISLITTLLLSVNAYSTEETLINEVKQLDSRPISEFNVINEKNHLLVVKFRDQEVTNALFYVPEKKEIQEQLYLNNDYATAKSENLKVVNREKGLEYIAEVYNKTGYMLKQIRTLSMGYNKFNIRTSDIESAIERLYNTGLFESIELEKEIQLEEVSYKPVTSNDVPKIITPNGYNTSKYTDTYIGGQDYLDSQQEYSMGSHGFFEALEYAKDNNNLNRKVRIAVIDSGYLRNYDQEEFVEGVDMTNSSFLKDCVSADNVDYSGSDYICPAEDLIEKERDTMPIDKSWRVKQDSEGNDYGELVISGHGLAVSSIIASINNNNNGIFGAAGADNVDIVHVKALTSAGSGSLSDIVDGIIWAAGGEVPGLENISEKVDVINLSLGGASSCDNITYLNDAISFAQNQDVVVVAAAGNASIDVSGFQPAGCKGVLTVSASDSFGEISPFSNYGDKVEVAFRGQDIYVSSMSESTYENPSSNSSCKHPETGAVDVRNCTAIGAGTSFAAPLASSAIALMKIVKPELSESELRALISTTAEKYDIDESGVETMTSILNPNAGIGNIQKAMTEEYNKYVVNNLQVSHRYKNFESDNVQNYLDALVNKNEGIKSTVCSLYNLSWGNFKEEITGIDYTVYGASGLSSGESMTPSNSEIILDGVKYKDILINTANYQKIGVQSLNGDIFEFDISSAELPSYCL